jgi:hypothetical protein
MIETQARHAGNLLERSQVGGGQHEVSSGRPSPAPANGRTCNGAEWKHHLANRLDLFVRADLRADVVRGPGDAPLDVQPVAVQSQ